MKRLLVVLLAALGAFAQPKARLSEVQNVEPKSYQVELSLDPEKTTFSGTIRMELDVRAATQTLWLNQNKIQVQRASAMIGGQQRAARVLPGGNDFVGLRFDSPLPAGPASVFIAYTGEVVEGSSASIFRQQEGGNWYLFTQFEPTDARGAFPCFDEPSYKTPWQVTLRVPEKSSAISNTPVASETAAAGTKTLVFKQTKPLPSYLVAFAVGPFEYVNAGTVGKQRAPVRIVVPKGRAADAKYAAEVTATILSRLETYFGIPYPYEKADQVAIPVTSGFAAMENVGMVTYAQNILLADPKTDTIARQRRYATVAAHELAHQWFGDLVTTAWWDDIWLNEAFATWKEKKLIKEWKPEWQSALGDVSDKLAVERLDSLMSARKVRQEIAGKDDITTAFDNITYQKGGAVIGMFEHWMGPEAFRKGVQSYLKQYSYRAVTAGEFLDSLSTSSRQNITKAFSTFLNQAGLPLIAVSLECEKGKIALRVEQERVVPLGSTALGKQSWNLPLCIRFGTGATGQSQCTMLTQLAESVELRGAKSCPTWVQANDGAVGYYAVEYRGGLLAALTNGDVDKRLTTAERMDLLGNAELLSNSGKMSAAEALALVERFANDPDRALTMTAVGIATSPAASLVPDALAPNYQRFLRKSFEARALSLGWEEKPGESEETRLLRPGLVRFVATLGGNQLLAAKARTLAEEWLEDRAAVGPNLVAAVLATAAYSGDKPLHEKFLAAFRSSTIRQDRTRLVSALAGFRDRASIEAGYNALVNGDVPAIEGFALLLAGQGNAATVKMPLEHLKSHWDAVLAKLPSVGGFDMRGNLPNVGASFCDAASRDELRALLDPHADKFLGARRNLDQVTERIDQCIANKAAQQASVAGFLSKY